MSMWTWIWTDQMEMTMIKHRISSGFGLVLMAFMLASCHITAPRGNAGYANLDSPGMRDTDRTFSLSLGRTTLRLAARFLDDDPEIRALLRSLDGVRVRVYEVTGDSDRIAQKFEHMGQKLNSDGWQPVMLVREEGEYVQMFTRSSGNRVQGLTVVSVDNEDVVVVNVMGDIDPKYYSGVMGALDVGVAPEIEVATVN